MQDVEIAHVLDVLDKIEKNNQLKKDIQEAIFHNQEVIFQEGKRC